MPSICRAPHVGLKDGVPYSTDQVRRSSATGEPNRSRCILGVWCFMPSILSEPDYFPVTPDEMGFALSLFVNAANRKTACRTAEHIDFHKSRRDECDDLFLSLCGEPGIIPSLGPRRRLEEEAPLHEAFRVLCEHYEDHRERASVCARVLAFYLLMERSAGAVLAGWIQPCPETPNLVILSPAVISAVSCVRLNGSILLAESGFLELVEKLAFSTEAAAKPPLQ